MKRILAIAAAGLMVWTAASRAEDKKVAYLGITTVPVGEALGAQLKLPPGVGLLVGHMDADSPGARALQKNDVLHKLDDQLLVNSEQLQALLGTHKPGDTVTFTVIRAGEAKKCEVKLDGRVETAATTTGAGFELIPSGIAKAFQVIVSTAGSNVIKALPQIGSNISALTGVHSSSTTQESSSQVCVRTTERGTFTLNCAGGKKTFTAVSKDGKMLFEGHVNTAEERAKLSDDLKKELEELEKTANSVKTK
jgi:hypothetical protein